MRSLEKAHETFYVCSKMERAPLPVRDRQIHACLQFARHTLQARGNRRLRYLHNHVMERFKDDAASEFGNIAKHLRQEHIVRAFPQFIHQRVAEESRKNAEILNCSVTAEYVDCRFYGFGAFHGDEFLIRVYQETI